MGLTSITLTDSLSCIRYGAFSICPNLTYLHIPNNPYAVRFFTNNLDNLNVLTLPDDLTTIDPEAFAGIDAEAIVLPHGCTSIGANAFDNCEQLQFILVPASITEQTMRQAIGTSTPQIIFCQ